MPLFQNNSLISRTIGASVLLIGSFTWAQDELSVPAQLLTPPPAPSMMAMRTPPVAEAPQVTPAARMPQYQLHRSDLGMIAHPESPSVRFLLATPGRPLLVEAVTTIDGQPYARPREQQIQKILSFINDPVAFREAEAKAAEEAKAKAATPETAISVLGGVLDFLAEKIAEEVTPAPATESKPNDEVKPAEPPAKESPEPKVEPPKDPELVATPKYAPPSTIYERIERHMQSTGTKPTAEEVRWMLANWTDGPVLLFLNDNFQRFRSTQQPLFSALDLNRDGVLASEEIASAVKSLEACDLDRNDVVESTEIAKVASDPRNRTAKTVDSHPLVLRLDHSAAMSSLMPRLTSCYRPTDMPEALSSIDPDHDGRLNDAEKQSLLERPADLTLRVELNTQQPEASRLSVVSADDTYQAVIKTAVRSPNTILLAFPTFALELSAAQGTASDQISIGAVNDGYAMLPELDPNGDGRFTIRELRTLVDRLKTFDRNGDGSISSDETLPTYRLCIALGPHAHQPLSVLRKGNSTTTPDSSAPEWFTEMDKNKDLDLTRKEFPGTDEQFQKLDRDSDQLISHTEASQANF